MITNRRLIRYSQNMMAVLLSISCIVACDQVSLQPTKADVAVSQVVCKRLTFPVNAHDLSTNQIGLDSSGNFYILDSKSILKFNEDGQLLQNWDTSVYLEPTELIWSLGTLDDGFVLGLSDGFLIVRGNSTQKLEYTSSEALMTSCSRKQLGARATLGASAIGLGSDSFLTCARNISPSLSVVKYSFQDGWQTFYEGDTPSEFSSDFTNLVVGWDGYVYLDDFLGTIAKFDSAGTKLDQFSKPIGELIGVDRNHDIYIWGYPLLNKLDENGDLVSSIELPDNLSQFSLILIDARSRYYYQEPKDETDSLSLVRCGE